MKQYESPELSLERYKLNVAVATTASGEDYDFEVSDGGLDWGEN